MRTCETLKDVTEDEVFFHKTCWKQVLGPCDVGKMFGCFRAECWFLLSGGLPSVRALLGKDAHAG